MQPWGLYMARPTPGRTQFHYLESWLLPTLGLRASVFHFNAGYEKDQDHYLDVGRFIAGDTVWTAEDHYIDLVVRNDRGVDMEDLDELFEAVQGGLLSTADAQRAVEITASTIDGLARHDYRLDKWIASLGMSLTWKSDG